MKRALTSIVATVLLLGSMAPAALADTSTRFVDVPANAPYAAAVSDLVFKGIINGVDGAHYAPSKSLTRAEMAAIMARALGLSPGTPATPTFADVNASHWAHSYINAVAQAGIETGVGTGRFDPDAHVTREQAAKMIVVALEQNGSLDPGATLTFADNASVDNWAVPYVALATQLKLVAADSANNFMGSSDLTRADAATWMDNLLSHRQDGTPVSTVHGFHTRVFAQGTAVRNNPDDITLLAGNTFVSYQNGIGTKGEANKSGGTVSTVVEYDGAGAIVNQWDLAGKCDGLTADPANNRILATVNEDGNSSMFIINPTAVAGQQVQQIAFNVDPGKLPTTDPLAWGGGTDSIAIQNGNIYLNASAPAADANGNFTHAALVQANIQGNTATLKPIMMGNATATDVASGNPVTLNVSDADSSTVVPSASAQYAGDLMVDDQGDSQLIFVHHAGAADQTQTRLSIGTQVNDVVWATSTQGTLYVTDTSANKVYAITGNFTPGTVFVACPNDSGVGSFVGILDLKTGNITPVAIGLKAPKGLLFVGQ
ncbi:MAG: putative cell wall binding protein [Firmicutes bacterium]|nr:putative cell wall binding protein [Bacillota bacterium]